MADKIKTSEFRLSFPNLFKAQEPMQAGGEAKFSLTMLFPKTADLSALKAAVKAAADAKWPDPKTRPKNLRNPIRDGDEKGLDGYADHFFIGASSKSRPGVVDQSVQPITDPAAVYAGCYCRATLTCYAYDKAGNRGVSFGLMNVQKLRDGEPFGNRSAPDDDFDAVAAAQGAKASAPAASAAVEDDDFL